jgi:hypothetical protein
MNARQFIKAVSNGDVDLIQVLLDLLNEEAADYCVIGGLAVNAYVEPVVGLDLDIVVIARQIDSIRERAQAKGLRVETLPHSINLGSEESDLRIQLQTDERYQAFIARATTKKVLGYEMQVAALEDVLEGKVWAWLDSTGLPSKRQGNRPSSLRKLDGETASFAATQDGFVQGDADGPLEDGFVEDGLGADGAVA